jgi:uncharacterized membrane protein YqjE
MALEHTKQATLPRILSTVVGDLADLVQKELRLARTEIVGKLSTKLQASIWMAAAVVLGLITLLLLVEAAVFAIASFGVALHWSCLIVAAAIGFLALVAFLKGRSDAQEEFTPTRTISQIKRDFSTAKEQLS